MGEIADEAAKRHSFSRESQDEFAIRSYTLAQKAVKGGIFKDEIVPVEIVKKYMIMSIHRIRSFLTLAMVDPTDLEIIEDVRFRTGLSIQPVIASESGVMNAINKYYGSADAIRVKKIIEDIALADDGRAEKIEGDVIIVGGGFTAVDCARTARRLAPAANVSIFYRRGEAASQEGGEA